MKRFYQKIHEGFPYLAICIVFSLAGLIVFKLVNRLGNREETSPEIGQVYKLTINKGNPFEEEINKYYEVLDVKQGFVLYVDCVDGDTSSESIRVFVSGLSKVEKSEIPNH